MPSSEYLLLDDDVLSEVVQLPSQPFYSHVKTRALASWVFNQYYVSRNPIKPGFGVSDHVGHKPACTVTEESKNLEILGISRTGIVLTL